MNPVLREGNSDRRAPASVKQYARKHPHSMGAWSPDSKTHVAHVGGDFSVNEKSRPLRRDRTCASSSSAPMARHGAEGETPLKAGEMIDATVMSKAALRAFLRADRRDAKAEGVLFSLHLKATMMKVSDPIIFGSRRASLLPATSSRSTATPLDEVGVDPEQRRGRSARGDPTLPADGGRHRGRYRRQYAQRARRWRWSTPTRASPTCTCRAT